MRVSERLRNFADAFEVCKICVNDYHTKYFQFCAHFPVYIRQKISTPVPLIRYGASLLRLWCVVLEIWLSFLL